MSIKIIQEKFGQDIMDLVANFAKADLSDPQTLVANEFSHVEDAALRLALAETLYGARWLYKLGLSLWVQNHELFAHVRAQIIDYGSVSEALLGSMIVHGVSNNYMTGTQWEFLNFNQKPNTKINWSNPSSAIEKTSFEWRIRVAREEGIIDDPLYLRISKLKGRRNSVHLTQKVSNNVVYYVGLSRSAYDTVYQAINQTKAWKAAHP
jgi:hypothetical protein